MCHRIAGTQDHEVRMLSVQHRPEIAVNSLRAHSFRPFAHPLGLAIDERDNLDRQPAEG